MVGVPAKGKKGKSTNDKNKNYEMKTGKYIFSNAPKYFKNAPPTEPRERERAAQIRQTGYLDSFAVALVNNKLIYFMSFQI